MNTTTAQGQLIQELANSLGKLLQPQDGVTGAAASGTIAAHVAPARFVTVELASTVTGLSAGSIRNHINRGDWVERREYVRSHGRIFVDLKGFEKWVQQAA